MKHSVFRVAAAVLAVFLLCVFPGCAGKEKQSSPLTVNGTPLPDEIFRYYLDEAFADPALKTKEERVEHATNRCIRYVAVNSAFAQMGLKLPAAVRAESSLLSNAQWKLFSKHYEKIGVSKETYIKICSSGDFAEHIRTVIFGKGGVGEITEDELKSYFDENYAAVKLFCGYLYTYDVYGNKKEYTQEEAQAVIGLYEKAVKDLNRGDRFDLVVSSLLTANDTGALEQSMQTLYLQADEPDYPDGLYEKIRETPVNSAAVFTSGDHIYLILRRDAFETAEPFEEHKEDCLKALSEAPLNEQIEKLCRGYSSVRRMDTVQEDYNELERILNNEQ